MGNVCSWLCGPDSNDSSPQHSQSRKSQNSVYQTYSYAAPSRSTTSYSTAAPAVKSSTPAYAAYQSIPSSTSYYVEPTKSAGYATGISAVRSPSYVYPIYQSTTTAASYYSTPVKIVSPIVVVPAVKPVSIGYSSYQSGTLVTSYYPKATDALYTWVSRVVGEWEVAFASLSAYKQHFTGLLSEACAEETAAVRRLFDGHMLTAIANQRNKTVYELQATSIGSFHFGDKFELRTRYGRTEVVPVIGIDEAKKRLKFCGISDAVSIKFLYSHQQERLNSAVNGLEGCHPLLPLLMGQRAGNSSQTCATYAYNPKLDTYQNAAIETALASKITLIHGPPGTGKTSVAAGLVTRLVSGREKVLVCAPSNVAADNLALRIKCAGGNVVRLYSRSKEEKDNIADDIAFHKKLKTFAVQQYPKLKEVASTRSAIQQRLTSSDFFSLCDDLLDRYSVVCCTCSAAADRLLSSRSFDTVLIDEAAFCIEPEALIPIVASNCKRLVLIGDPKQLRPIVTSKTADGLKKSLFERLEAVGVTVKMLETQYRMHPVISEYPRLAFYEGILKNGIKAEDRAVQGKLVPLFRSPLLFINTFGQEESYFGTTSKCNKNEATAVLKYLRKLLSCNVPPSSIGIVTAYEGQKLLLTDLVFRQFRAQAKDIEIKNIDGYQGREKDFIIISCVRANWGGEIGFLKDDHRINVALTRAKYGLIVVGNAKTLKNDGVWKGLIQHAKKAGGLVWGQKPKRKTQKGKKPDKND